MSVARTVAEVLAGHVTLELEAIDRLYLDVYVPRLQHVGGWWGAFGRIAGSRSRRRR